MSADIVKTENKTPAVKIEPIELRPVADVFESDCGLTVIFEVPGANAQTVSVAVENRVMEVVAASSLKRYERPVVFKRTFQLSDAVDVEKITAKTVDGVLTLCLPKSEKAKVHKIKVL